MRVIAAGRVSVARGPVVIDWTNACAGDSNLDVALTWVIGATVGKRGRARQLLSAEGGR